MHRRRLSAITDLATDDEGSAALEFITVGVILLVPLVYLVIVLGTIQEQAFGVEAAARHTARAIATAPDRETASARSDSVLASVVDEYGIDAAEVGTSVRCLPAGQCPAAGATIIVTIETRVRMPFVPAIFGLAAAATIPVEATATQKVSKAWGG